MRQLPPSQESLEVCRFVPVSIFQMNFAAVSRLRFAFLSACAPQSCRSLCDCDDTALLHGTFVVIFFEKCNFPEFAII